MLFRLELANNEATMLGYRWIEVVAIHPFRYTEHVSDPKYLEEGQKPNYMIAQAQYICRTDIGLVRISEDDLWSEIEAGIYFDPSLPEEIEVTCPHCAMEMLLADNGWSAAVCEACKGEIPYPSKEAA